jgi:O-antigen/teichoic acid export membrane protein
LVARYLGPSEFGVAAAIILTVSFLDSLSNAGTQNLLVQARSDNEGKLLATANAISISRGALTGLALLAFVVPLAHFIDIGIPSSSIALVALSSLIAGFTHRGVRSVQRSGDFLPDSLSQLIGDVGGLLVAVPVAAATHSHISIVIGLIVRSTLTMVVSHLMVKLPYRPRFSQPDMREFWVFGWPLLLNGPLVFLSAQADRIFVSFELGAYELGIYSAILVLVTAPSTAIMRWMGTISLPVLSKAFHRDGALKPEGPIARYSTSMLALAWVMLAGFVWIGPIAVPALYGDKYSASILLVSLIGILQIVRFLRSWPSTIALSIAAGSGILISTIIRLLALPIGLAGLMLIGGMPGLVVGFIAGEMLALVASIIIVNLRAGRPLSADSGGVALFCLMAAALLCARTGMDVGPLGAAAWLLFTLCLTPLFVVAVVPLQVINRLARLRD